MYQIPVLSPSGRRELAADLPAEINPHLLWEVVRWQLAKRRAGNASTKRISARPSSPVSG